MKIMKPPKNLIERIFSHIGYFVGSYPIYLILASIILTIIMSLGLMNFQEVNNVRTEYSPLHAQSRTEYAVAKKFLKQNGTMDPCYIMTHARNRDNLLKDEYRLLIYNLTKTLQTELFIEKNGKKYGFVDLCEPYCELNAALLAFLKLYKANDSSTHTYPTLELFGTQAFIGNNVYDVELKPDSNELSAFRTVVMPFYLVASYEDTDILQKWQDAAIKLFEEPRYNMLLKTGMTSDYLVSKEVRRMGYETAPLIGGSIMAMIVFVIVCSIRFIPAQSKPWEALIGCLIPLLALCSSLGVMSGMNIEFQSIVVASLFLVLSVGVDDIFIILRAWDRSDPTAPLPERMSSVLEDAGPSITISSLTNAVSFMVGAFSDTPAIRTFCIYSAIAIIICWLYQLIVFSSIVGLSNKRENKGYQAILCCFKANPQARNAWLKDLVTFHDWLVKKWAKAVTKWPTRVVLVLLMMGYFTISWIGISRLRVHISIDKMALPDSYLQEFQNTFESALRNMQPISVFVLNPGDLRDPERLQRVKNLVEDYETATNSYGPGSTFFWLRPYEEFLRFYGESDEFTYTEIPSFFRSATYIYLTSFVHYNETACNENLPECIPEFFFITNFHEVIKYHELIPAVKHWRKIAEKYKDLDVYPYSDHTPFVDQTMSIDSTLYGSVAVAIVCTALICWLFIPHTLSIITAVFSVFSISWGIFGLLSLWGVDLDPLSMAALLMAIGFSIDFTAHISFHYYKTSSELHPRKRIEHALGVIGWPMIQVGLSTIVALFSLIFKPSYLALVFLKTIVIVVLLGMFHGLIILPAVLTMITRYEPVSSISSSAESSERSSRSSRTERKESFYKTQRLIRSINKEIAWLSQRKSSDPKNRSNDKVQPIGIDELSKVHFTGPTAFVHRIPLGRTASNSL